MKISPADMKNLNHSSLEDVAIAHAGGSAISEIAKPIFKEYQAGFAPVITRPFIVFIGGLLFFVATLFYLTN